MTNLESTKICIQKFLPEHYNIIQNINSNNNDILQAAFYKSKIWPPNTIIYISFNKENPIVGNNNFTWTQYEKNTPQWEQLDPLQKQFTMEYGTPKQQTVPNMIKIIVNERYVPLLAKSYIQLIFLDFNDKSQEHNPNHIKIDFNGINGAWSFVGTDIKNQSKNGTTMNLGWFDVGTVLHEFGHSFGMIHEHSSSFSNPINWNKKAVYAWALETQGWDKQTTDTQILNTVNSNLLIGSQFDPFSVMLYFFPADLTLDDIGTKQNLRLSATDMEFIHKNYGIGSSGDVSPMTPEELYTNIYGENYKQALLNSNISRKNMLKNFIKNNVNNSNSNSNKFPLKLFLICLIIIFILIGILFFIIIKFTSLHHRI